mmetsp:Transcript_3707/g.12983  ORF Transcript_3707/g.12983 Transcript_3707/m.12983 type:complete len:313 (-) Transcript_3707:1059-1997(-)
MNCMGGGLGPLKKLVRTGSNTGTIHRSLSARSAGSYARSQPSPGVGVVVCCLVQCSSWCCSPTSLYTMRWSVLSSRLACMDGSPKMASTSWCEATLAGRAARWRLRRVICPSCRSSSTPSVPVSVTSPTLTLFCLARPPPPFAGETPCSARLVLLADTASVLVEPTAYRPTEYLPLMRHQRFVLDSTSSEGPKDAAVDVATSSARCITSSSSSCRSDWLNVTRRRLVACRSSYSSVSGRSSLPALRPVVLKLCLVVRNMKLPTTVAADRTSKCARLRKGRRRWACRSHARRLLRFTTFSSFVSIVSLSSLWR